MTDVLFIYRELVLNAKFLETCHNALFVRQNFILANSLVLTGVLHPRDPS